MLFDEPFLRKLERLALISRREAAGQLQGERRSTKRGYSVEFTDFRPYVPGDDFRRIDWNAYARLERFFIKLFIEEEDLSVHFLIDTSQSMDWGKPNKLEYALRAVGAIAYVALVGLDRVTVTTRYADKIAGYGYLAPLRGKRNAMKLFSFLQSITAQNQSANGHGTAAWLNAYASGASRPGPVLLVSDLMDDGWRQGISSLASRGFEVSVLHTLSPDEVDPGTFTDPPLSGDFKLIDSETNSAIEITADFDVLEHYRQNLSSWRETWRRFCGARNMPYISVETSLPLEELLFTWLRQQGLLK
jgi:uncharacterized protein (DUF58 family)